MEERPVYVQVSAGIININCIKQITPVDENELSYYVELSKAANCVENIFITKSEKDKIDEITNAKLNAIKPLKQKLEATRFNDNLVLLKSMAFIKYFPEDKKIKMYLTDGIMYHFDKYYPSQMEDLLNFVKPINLQ